MTLSAARQTNVWFLVIVATWRVVLYAMFLIRYAGFRELRLLVGTLLPLTIIVFGLASLNLERAVFDIMAGLDPAGTSADSAYSVLFLLSVVSFFLAPVMLLFYIIAIALAGPKEKH